MSNILLYDRVTKRNMSRFKIRVYPHDLLNGFDIEFSGSFHPVQPVNSSVAHISSAFAATLDLELPLWRLPNYSPFDVYRLDAVGEWRLIICHLSHELAFGYSGGKPYRLYDSLIMIPGRGCNGRF